MTPDTFVELITIAGYDVTSYSGRGMYGNSCVGVRVANDSEMLAMAANIAIECDDAQREELPDIVGNAKTDNMGRGLIVYFPNMPMERES